MSTDKKPERNPLDDLGRMMAGLTGAKSEKEIEQIALRVNGKASEAQAGGQKTLQSIAKIKSIHLTNP